MAPQQSAFYVTGGTLRHDAPSYVERQADKDLYDSLVQGEFCYVLTSRQMGKSSLMVRTAGRLREENIRVVALDLTALGQNLSPEQWYNGLVISIGQQLGLEDELDEIWVQEPRLGPLQRLMKILRETVLGRIAQPLVLFVDEIDIVRSLPFSTDEFFAAIRECYNRRSADSELMRLTFCLLGVATPSDLIRDTRSTPFNIGRRIELNDFTAAESAPLAQGWRGHGQDPLLARALMEQILSWTGGHPYLTQRLCQAVADDAQATTIRDVGRLCRDLFLSHGARDKDDNLLFVRERILRSEVDLTGLLELYRRVWMGKSVFYDEANALVTILRLAGLVRVANGRLRVRNRIYAFVFDKDWIEAHLPEAELRRQKAAYRRGMVRAAVVATIILGAVSFLAFYAWKQARRARQASAQALFAQAQAGRLSGRAGQRFDSLKAIRQATEIRATPELRNEAIAALALTDLRPLKQWSPLSPGGTGFALDKELARYARGEASGRITLRRVDSDQELLSLPGTGLPVEHLHFSPDGRLLAVQYGRDARGQFQVLDLSRGEDILNVVEGVEAEALDFSPDSTHLALAQKQGRVEIYDLVSGRQLKSMELAAPANAIRFDPTGRRLAVSSGESFLVRILDWAAGTTTQSFTHRGPVKALAWHPHGGYVAAACTDGDIYVWDTERGEQFSLLKGSDGEAHLLAFNHSGEVLASLGVDETLRLWHPLTGRQLIRLPGVGVSGRLEFGPKDRALGYTAAGGMVTLWEIAGGVEYRVLHGQAASAKGPSCLSISPGSRLLISVTGDGLQLWELSSGRKLNLLKLGGTSSAHFDPGGYGFIVSDLFGMHRFRVDSRPTTINIPMHIGPAENLEVRTPVGITALSANGRFLSCVQDEYYIIVRDLLEHDPPPETETELKNLHSVKRLAISPEGKWVASSFESAPVKVWNATPAGKTVELPVQSPAYLAFSPDGQSLVTGGNSEFRFWAVGSWQPGRIVSRKTSDQPGPLAFSKDGRLLALAKRPSLIELIDPADGESLAALESPDQQRLSWLGFSADRRLLIAATDNHLIQIWDLPAIRRELAAFKLDWAHPEDSTPSSGPEIPLQVTIHIGDLESSKLWSRNQIDALTREIQNAPNDAHNYHERGHIYARGGRWREAEADFRKGVDLSPGFPPYHSCLAGFLAAQNRLEEAIEITTRLIAAQPETERVQSYLNRAGFYYRFKNYEAALRDLEQVLLVDPNSWIAPSIMALFMTGGPPEFRNPAAALTLAEKATGLHPEARVAQLALGASRYRSGQMAAAVESLEKALALSRDTEAKGPLERLYLAMSYHRLGQTNKAQDNLQQAVAARNNPGNLGWIELNQLNDLEKETVNTLSGSR